MGRGRLIVVAGPSGVGKTTLVTEVVRRRPDVHLSVSATTRPPRAGEVDGVSYRFLDPSEFARLETEGAFLESAAVHGARYGTPRAPVEGALRAGRSVILEIDVQGAWQVREAMPEAVLVFVEPPGEEEWLRRLRDRGTEAPEAMERRIAAARDELRAAAEFDHRVVNADLGSAVDALIRILDGPASPPTGERPSKEQR